MVGFLASYWYYKNRSFVDTPGPLILDSGAFSAHTQGGEVNIHDLSAFYRRVAEETPDALQWTISLDVMGDHAASLRNWLEMRKDGVETVPVIHFTSPLPFEDQITPYLEAGTERVCFGGMVGAVSTVNHWAAHGLRWMRDNSPDILTHGLGVGPWTKRGLLPWDSTDCSDFGLAYRFGTARIPHPSRRKPIDARIGTGHPPSRSVASLIRSYDVDPRECTSSTSAVRTRALAVLSFRASEYEEFLENERRCASRLRPVERYVVDAARTAGNMPPLGERPLTRYVVDNQTMHDMSTAEALAAGDTTRTARLVPREVSRYIVDNSSTVEPIIFAEMRRANAAGAPFKPRRIPGRLTA